MEEDLMWCYSCGKDKTPEGFYKYDKRTCKACIRKKRRKERIANPEKFKKRDRKRNCSPERMERDRLRNLVENMTEEQREARQKRSADWCERNKKSRAKSKKLQMAVKKGDVIRPINCSCCGKLCKTQGYYFGEQLEWLCHCCGQRKKLRIDKDEKYINIIKS